MTEKSNLVLRFAFLVALVATAGSLYFSEVLLYPPCVLCWYQRICMYPLVLLFGVGLAKEEPKVWSFTIPLVVIGLAIAAYHCLLYYGVIPDSITPCSQGISCTSKHINYFGFITIPLLSFVAFSLILVSNILGIKKWGAREK